MRRLDHLEWVRNELGRSVPVNVNGEEFEPYETYLGIKPKVGREVGRVTRWRKIGQTKLVDGIQEVIKKSGLCDGMAISFHHHLRNGDRVMNLVVEKIRNLGIKDLTIYPSAMFPVHQPIIDAIKDGTISTIEGSLNGPIGRYASLGNMDNPVVLRSHSGRVRALSQGEIHIDVAFLGASCCDELGNCNGLKGSSAFGPLGFGYADALYADKTVIITDNLVPFPAIPIQIPGTNVDFIVEIDSIGDPDGILSGTLKITDRADHLKIVKNTMDTMSAINILKDGFSFQAGAGGISLALTKKIGDHFLEKGLKASYANGGTTRYLVDMLRNGTLETLSTGQAFDISAIESLLEDKNHIPIIVDQYSNIHSGATTTEPEHAAFLGATEVDLNFNVNVNTHSDGYLLHGIGGHQDVAFGSQITFITVPTSRKRNPIIREEVTTITTPGELIDIIVTESGISVNTITAREEVIQRNQDIEVILKSKGLPVLDIEEMRRNACRDCEEITPNHGDQLIGIVKYIDGTVLDHIKSVEEK
jgi:citrate lyase subunit alpha/citrate CoA-transferase